MKFMKLGSKPDAFQTNENNVRFVASELPTDVIVHADDVKFHLHKFPLLSKSNKLHKFVQKANEEGTNEIYLDNFPGGPNAFEICSKFCYGMTVTLNAYNVVAVRCASEYLEMTEDVEKGNLIYKIEIFLNTSIFRCWKDSIIVLQTTKYLLPWSEELKIVGRCIDCIASKTSVDPSLVNWSYSYSKRLNDQIVEIYKQNSHIVPNDWWVEDICELDVDLYKRVMSAIKSKGRMSPELIGEGLRAYAVRWLPDSYEALISEGCLRSNRLLVETLISLLPNDKNSACSCKFLLKLLKIVVLIEAGEALKEDLMNKVSLNLHKASVKDLLIPGSDTIYDVELVKGLVSRFMVQEGMMMNDCDMVDGEERKGKFMLGNGILLSLGKLIDGYLVEIASDSNLSISSFIDLSNLLPESARPTHDGVYTAVDTYLQEHPNISKAEKKKICSLINVKKISREASIHAAQNDRLPLRLIVQVLFFEQLRASSEADIKISVGSARTTCSLEESWEKPTSKHFDTLKKDLKSMKLEDNKITKSTIKSKGCNGVLLPSRSRRIFDKLWASTKGDNNKSSDTSGSSHSPPLSSVNPLEASKSSGSSSRNNRRHSVS